VAGFSLKCVRREKEQYLGAKEKGRGKEGEEEGGVATMSAPLINLH